MGESKDKVDEAIQLKKIKFKWPNNERFKNTWRNLLEEDPSLMRGVGKTRKYGKKKK